MGRGIGEEVIPAFQCAVTQVGTSAPEVKLLGLAHRSNERERERGDLQRVCDTPLSALHLLDATLRPPSSPSQLPLWLDLLMVSPQCAPAQPPMPPLISSPQAHGVHLPGPLSVLSLP